MLNGDSKVVLPARSATALMQAMRFVSTANTEMRDLGARDTISGTRAIQSARHSALT